MGIEPSVDRQDNRLGSVYIRVSSHAVARTLPMSNSDDPDLLVDVDRRGKLVGVEVLGLASLREFCEIIASGLPSPYKSELSKYCAAV